MILFNSIALVFLLVSNSGLIGELIPGQDSVCEFTIAGVNLLLALKARLKQ